MGHGVFGHSWHFINDFPWLTIMKLFMKDFCNVSS